MKTYDRITDLIGKTPLVKLNHVGVPDGYNCLQSWNCTVRLEA